MTKTYIVTQKHTLGHKVGAEIELSDKQAKNLVGKVRLKDDVIADGSGKSDLVDNLEGLIKEKCSENESLREKLLKANEAGEALGLRVEGLCEKINDGDEENLLLNKENEALKAEIEGLKKPVAVTAKGKK